MYPWLKKVELIGCFLERLFKFSMKDDSPFVLFVGELQNIYLTGRRQCGLHLFAVGFCAGMAGAHTHIDAELAHLKTQIQKS